VKIFLSWSGDRSRAVADVLKNWLPSVLQAVRPYFSPEDIEKGSKWSQEISKELDQSDFGILCLTPENIMSPWMLFEAGALSKKLEMARVAPLLVGLEPTDVSGPLAQLQLTKLNQEDCFLLLKSMNKALGEKGLQDGVLITVFQKWWPDLDEKIKVALEDYKLAGFSSDKRSNRDLMEEVLDHVRAMRYDRSEQLAQVDGVKIGIRRGVPIEVLNISVRAVNCLHAEGIDTLDSLLELTPIDLLKIPNLGRKAQTEIISMLADRGLSLKI
jgi:hypothetical protein